MHCVFILLEKKVRNLFEALKMFSDGLYRKHQVLLGHLTVVLDFELAVQQAIRQALQENCIIQVC